MAKISLDSIRKEVEEHGWQVLSTSYTNLKTEMNFLCSEGHSIYLTWDNVRKNFSCPVCKTNRYKTLETKVIEKKKDTIRVLALDQSTKKTGYSIFDNGKLIRYGVFETSLDDEIARDSAIKTWLLSILHNWQPDYVGIEGIQYEERYGVTTFETLARLQGILLETLFWEKVPYCVCHTATWRTHCGVKGKSLANSEKIPTLDGWKTVEDIKVGDFLFDGFGKPTKVLAVYPQGKLDVYKVLFKDGREIRCSKDHLWSFISYRQRDKSKKERNFMTKTTEELLNKKLKTKENGYKFFVPYTQPVYYNEKKLEIPPYVLGCMLGDGSFRLGQEPTRVLQFSSKNDVIPKKICEIMEWDLKKSGNSNYTYYFSFKEKNFTLTHTNVQIKDFLKSYPELINKTSKEKFIPSIYLQGSMLQRIELLRGLIDTDGTTSCGRIKYITISKILANQVQELAFSLGLSSSIQITEPRGFGKHMSYTVSIYGNPSIKKQLCSLPEKQKNLELNNKQVQYNYNPIVKIEKTNEQEEMTCFLVDNKEHLFLAGDYIVTHNTRVDKKRSMQSIIKKIYDVTVTDDEADAIGIGKYVTDTKVKQAKIENWE